MAMAAPVQSLRHFNRMMDAGWDFPFYCVLLYTPGNGLNQKLHEYVVGHWPFLNELTGNSCLLLAVEDQAQGPRIEQFRPEDVYGIARKVGAQVSDVPCMVFFTDPRERNDIVILRLGRFLPPPTNLQDEHLTDFFQRISAITDKCGSQPVETRLDALRDQMALEWPTGSHWYGDVVRAGAWLVAASTGAKTVADALGQVLKLLRDTKVIS
jgi:hypothetical protein